MKRRRSPYPKSEAWQARYWTARWRRLSKAQLPPRTEAPGRPEVDGYATAAATARQHADADISAINRSVEDARAKATAEATALEEGLVARCQAAADEIAQIEARVRAARDAEAAAADASGTATTRKAR